jgi:hypothetical protein
MFPPNNDILDNEGVTLIKEMFDSFIQKALDQLALLRDHEPMRTYEQ